MLSQKFNDSQRPKNSKNVRSAKNEQNQFIYDKFDALRKAAQMRNNKNIVNCYAKILRSLEKYPLPLLSAQQAIQLDGVGAKMAALIGNLIQKKNSQSSQTVETEPTNEIEDKENKNSNSVPDLFSQMSEYTRLLEINDSFSGMENCQSPKRKEKDNEKITSLDSILKKKSPKALKRTRDEADIIQVPKKETLKRFHTMENYTIDNFEDMYNENAQSLWSANEMEDFSKVSTDENLPMILNNLKEKQAANTVKKMRSYNPEKSTGGFNILVGLLIFENETKKKYASKKEIKQAIKKEKETLGDLPINSWAPMTTLIKYDLVLNFTFSDEEKFSLTENGYNTATECYIKTLEKKNAPEEQKTASDSTKECTMAVESSNSGTSMSFEGNKLLNEGNVFEINNENTSESTKPIEDMKINENTRSIEIVQTKNVFRTSQRIFDGDAIVISEDEDEKTVTFSHFEKLSASKDRVIATENEESNKEVEEEIKTSGHIVKKSLLTNNWSLVLCVDNREIKSKKDRDYIYEKMVENGVSCRLLNLNLGDFLWTIEVGEGKDKAIYVLDYVIERKTADDLASSIIDKRYNQQKFRLMNSNIKNIFYLVEGKASQNAGLPQSTIDSAIINTQIVQNFKVRTTQSIQQTIRLITEMHLAIESKFAQEVLNTESDYVEFRYKFEEYQTVVSKSQGLTTKIHFGNMLRSIKGCGKEMVNQILDKFDTLHQFYSTLRVLDNEQERLEYLGAIKKKKSSKAVKLGQGLQREIEPELRLNKNVAGHIIKLFFEDSYPKIIEKKTSELCEEINQ